MSPIYRKSDGPIHTAKVRLDMQKAMQADAAVFRYVLFSRSFYYLLRRFAQYARDSGRGCAEAAQNLQELRPNRHQGQEYDLELVSHDLTI